MRVPPILAGPDGEFGSDFDPALADQIAVAGIFVCPTINVTAPIMRGRHGPVLEEVIMSLHQHGVPLIAGTDAGTDDCPHGAYVGGLEALAEVGLPAREVLEAATLRAARALGVEDRTGSIAPGKDADLIAIRGDPLRDVSALHRIELVVTRGRQFIPAAPPSSPR